MRVCHLCDGSVAGDYFRNISTGLTRNGVDVLLVELGPGKALSSFMKRIDESVQVLNVADVGSLEITAQALGASPA